MGGQQVMAALYPGFLDRLDTLGAVRCRAGTELVYYLPTGMVDVLNLVKPLAALHEEPLRSRMLARQRHQGAVVNG